MRTSLFREDARKGQAKSIGEIVLVRPLSFSVLAALAAAATLLLIAFALFGSYTKRATVSGYLAPDLGLLRLYPPQPGTVFAKHVREGQAVNKGDQLYLVSAERQSGKGDGIQASISRYVALRQQSLQDELQQTRQLHRDQALVLQTRVDTLVAEKTSLAQQIGGQQARIKLAKASADRAAKLQAQGFFSRDMAQQKQAELLDQRDRLQTLERGQIGIDRDLQAARNDLASLPITQRNQLAQLERQIANTTQEFAESESKRELAITAPQSGIATGVTADPGQAVDPGKPLLSIIPNGALMEAHLYAPSRAIGFIRPGNAVLLRYQAYPYQKFGHARGTVTSISRSAINGDDNTSRNEALYRITVALQSQTVRAYGQGYFLQPGMLVDADILLEQRKLYEWALEPLFSLTGKM
ncbi:HlyD family secretion protein [Massilia sp. CF038]|uniref:HlyD family secretion protein n=1 Tax=Massilia sp. CF038 TaxID=1881045 RepID=UPI0009145B33|nr:HlyD family efflux transporter periplasmic adaptor subunit [Massilia sp. CF038]SHG42195.1 membrane fusion protein [Massilia sp. CF038]